MTDNNKSKPALAIDNTDNDRAAYEMKIVEELFERLDENDMKGADAVIEKLKPRGALTDVTKKN